MVVDFQEVGFKRANLKVRIKRIQHAINTILWRKFLYICVCVCIPLHSFTKEKFIHQEEKELPSSNIEHKTGTEKKKKVNKKNTYLNK